MWTHLGHLIGTVIGVFFDTIGTTLLGFLIDGVFAISLAIAVLNRKRKMEGWRAMLNHWRDEYRAGAKFALLCAIVIYGPVILWSVGKAVYDDHQGLMAHSAKLARDNDALGNRYQSCDRERFGKSLLADQLSSQVSQQQSMLAGQQGTFNQCVLALGVKEAESPKITTRIASVGDQVQLRGGQKGQPTIFISETTKAFPNVNATLHCNEEFDVIGSDLAVGFPIPNSWSQVGISRSDNESFSVNMSNPWTPNNALVFAVVLHVGGPAPQGGLQCSVKDSE